METRTVDLGKVVGPAGPNEVTSSTDTALNGVLFGNGSKVGAKVLDTSSLSDDNDHVPTSGVVKSAIDNAVVANPTLAGTESDLTALQVNGTKYKVPSGGSGGGSSLNFTVTLAVASWSNKSITVSNANFVASGYEYFVAPDAQSFDTWCACRIYGADVTTNGSMTFACDTTPTSAVTVNVSRREATA